LGKLRLFVQNRRRNGMGKVYEMKLIMAIIKPLKLDDVRDTLTPLVDLHHAVRIRTGESD
jgi:hypothetical protein